MQTQLEVLLMRLAKIQNNAKQTWVRRLANINIKAISKIRSRAWSLCTNINSGRGAWPKV